MVSAVILDMEDLRAVAGYAVSSAAAGLEIFERACPADPRPRAAVDAAWAFAHGGKRVKALRDAAWTALRAAQETENPAAEQAARAAMAAASAAYLHPLTNAAQVKHILGAAAHAARAFELAGGDMPDIGEAAIGRAAGQASPHVVQVLCRFPPAPTGGGRVGSLLRRLDQALRGS